MNRNKCFKQLRLLLLSAAVIPLMALRTSAQTRIAVVSDIHVMAPSLLESGAEGKDAWTSYYANQRKMLQQSAAIFDQFVTEMKNASLKPDILLITGDLTKDGEQASHDYVKTKLAELEEAGIACYVIPGNHDFGTDGSHLIYKADGTTTGAAVLATDKFAGYYEDYGYNTTFESELDPNGSLSYVTEPVPGLVLIAIDSHSGSIGPETLTWVCEQAEAAREKGKQVIAMMHHPLFPHITGANLFISTYQVNDYVIVRDALIGAGVKVILTGHFHTSDIAKDWDNEEEKAIYDINTGSLISYPCDYRILTLSGNMETLDVATYSLTPEGMTADECKTWLKERTVSIAKAKIEAEAKRTAGSMWSLMESTLATPIENIAALAGDLFILHAEGNENSSADRESVEATYNSYKTQALYSQIFNAGDLDDATIYSILDNKSNYGGDHENQTNDRTLSIGLPSLDETVTIPASGWASFCTGHSVDISLTPGLKAYTVTAVSGDKATLAEATKIASGDGFLLKGSGGNYTLKAATEAVEPDEANLLYGTLDQKPAEGGDYALATFEGVTGFYPVSTSVVIPARKAYLSITSGARIITFASDSEATGIQAVEEPLGDDAAQPVYTLQGTRAGALRPGVYIRGGKKIVIR